MIVVKPNVMLKPIIIEIIKKKIALKFLKAIHKIIVTKKRLKKPAIEAPLATEDISS